MNLIEEAVVINIFGIRMYAFGVYTALGALAAVAVLAYAGKVLNLKRGTVSLTAVLSMFFGLLISRISFCLLNRELGRMTPLTFWPQLNGGGWSMFGLICGIYFGGWISARITKEKTGSIMDALSLSILPMIAAERIGENRIEDFDISRPLDSTALNGTFLVVGEDEPCLATYYLSAVIAVILFFVLAFRFMKTAKEGNLTIEFLMLFGAASIITESLRYDRFLSITFVGLQQIAAALMLALGVLLAVRYNKKPKTSSIFVTVTSLIVMTGCVIGLEFALDRTTWNKILIYILMIIIVNIPVLIGFKMQKNAKKGNKAA